MPGKFRTTVRFPEKDWLFLHKLVKAGEFNTEVDAIRAAVKLLRERYISHPNIEAHLRRLFR
jgi:Arc/MetJ-type ribon-helix-helix transcriptional regulator